MQHLANPLKPLENALFSADVAVLFRGTDPILNNSYVQLSKFEHDFVTCTMSPSEQTIHSPEVKWYYPDGKPVRCTSKMEPFNCNLTEDRLGVRLYRNLKQKGPDAVKKMFEPGLYSCCLPWHCNDGKSIRATLRIWGKCSQHTATEIFNSLQYPNYHKLLCRY